MTRDNQRHLLITACLLLVTFLVHARALGFGFCDLDDVHQIIENPTLQWRSAPDYFVKDVWRNPQPQYRTYYRPMFLLWLLVNLKLFGLHPTLWHLAALALHGAVVVMVYRLGLRLMGNELIAAAAALLFAVHPTHVESVVWLSGVTEPLAGVFFLGAFLEYLRWRETRRTRPMVLCALLTLLALMAKETSAALPLLIALYECLFPSAPAENLSPRIATAAYAVAPTFGGAAIYACMRLFAMHHVVFVNNSPARVLMTWPLLLWDYTRMMFWPSALAVYYDAQLLKQPSAAQFWLPLAFVIVGAALLAYAFVRNKLAAFLGCWWLLPIVPALVGLFSFPANDIIHDRYTYLSSVAFVLLLAWGLSRLARSGMAFRLPIAVLFLALVCGWSMLTVRQTQVWSNGFTLYGNGVKVSPNNVRVRNLLAIQLFKAGDAPQAFALWDSTLKLDPDAFDTNYALGVTLFAVGKLPQAEFFLRRACELDRKKPESFLNLADLLVAENRRDDALEVLRQALSTVDANPDLLQQKIAEIKAAK